MIRQEDLGRLRRFDQPESADQAQRPDSPAKAVIQSLITPPDEHQTAVRPSEQPLPVSEPVQALKPVPVPHKTSTQANMHQAKRSTSRRRPLLAAGLAGASLAVLVGGFFFFRPEAAANPVPINYQSAVDYPAFYPDAAKLPVGYKLSATSFSSPAKGIILYKIDYASGQHLIVSLQDKPSASNLQAFNSQRIPLHATVSTPVGQAVVGAIGDQTIVSLPTSTKTWIIVTAPYDINTGQLDQVLKSFKS